MKFRRKKYLVHKKFQVRLLGVLLSIVFLATFVSILLTHYFILSSIVNFTWQAGHSPTGKELILASIKPLIIIVPIIFIILAFVVIFISHRIAGPLIRLKNAMEKVGDGDLSVKVQFRKYDEIHDVAESFNKMVQGLKEKFGKE